MTCDAFISGGRRIDGDKPLNNNLQRKYQRKFLFSYLFI